ncbi:hypothetical protein E1B28_012960 [Marasmius oreades]|uniref:Uncharacterized protein n=1 Tax=Marasmius oreades TaxID=181124 RepID=A0A9P7RNY2_9AGAR|nr:uncharacterized protein E1B28_012960 [Marasmius oreades]KAG7086982.1 hypothetical protein E1B28_012960 [Marasmius oreades]
MATIPATSASSSNPTLSSRPVPEPRPSTTVITDFCAQSQPDTNVLPPFSPSQKPTFLNFRGLKKTISRITLKASGTYESRDGLEGSEERVGTQPLSLVLKKKLSVLGRLNDVRKEGKRVGTGSRAPRSRYGTEPLEVKRKHSLSSLSLFRTTVAKENRADTTRTQTHPSLLRTRSLFGLRSRKFSMSSTSVVGTNTGPTDGSTLVSSTPTPTFLCNAFESAEAEARWTRLLAVLELDTSESNCELEEDRKCRIRRSRSFSDFQNRGSGFSWDKTSVNYPCLYELELDDSSEAESRYSDDMELDDLWSVEYVDNSVWHLERGYESDFSGEEVDRIVY